MLGRNHTLVRRLRALRRDGALRREEGVYVAEGTRLAREALLTQAPVEQVVVSPALGRTEDGRTLLAQIRERGLACEETTERVLDSMQDARSPQPIVMLVRRTAHELESCVEASVTSPLVVIAHALQDPGNLGTLLRTADAAGADAFLVSGEAADLFHPRTVRASMGSIFRVPALASEIDTVLDWCAARGIGTLAADPSAGVDVHAADLRQPLALIFGREGQGLPSDLLTRLDGCVRVPMRAGVESLSVGAAAAVVLFEAARQRRVPG